MPTVFIVDGFRFFFYSNENNEPPHIHVKKGSANGKIWLLPKFEIAYLHGFTVSETKEIETIALHNIELLIKHGMNILENKYDFLESIIFNDGLSIQNIDFHKELDLMLIVLNTKAVLQQRITNYPLLSKASSEQLYNYELMANGTGVHWPELDEDLSLKGFLQDEIRKVVKHNIIAA